MVCAYILVQTSLGKALEVREKICEIEGVSSACAVTGAYDIVVTVNTEKLSDIAELIVKKIHCVEGICTTQTLICVSCE